jgi:phage gp37-like protein
MVAPLSIPVAFLAIQAIEDSFVAAIKASPVGPLLKDVNTIPGDFSPEEVGDRLRLTPGAYVAFSGGQGLDRRAAGIEAHFTVFVVTGQGAKEADRRRGSKVVVGAYTLLQAIAMTLHGVALPAPSIEGVPIPDLGVGAPQLVETARYWAEGVDKMNLCIYAAIFSLQVQFPPMPTAGEIANFLTFFGQIDINGVPDGVTSLPLMSDRVSSEDQVTLVVEDGAALGTFFLGGDTLG